MGPGAVCFHATGRLWAGAVPGPQFSGCTRRGVGYCTRFREHPAPDSCIVTARSACMSSSPPTYRIVVIDDERPILLTLEALLKRHRYDVHLANTASLGAGMVR